MGMRAISVVRRAGVLLSVVLLSGCAPNLLDEPTNFRVVSTLGGSVWLDWNPVPDANEYRIDRRSCPGVDCVPGGDMRYHGDTELSSYIDDDVVPETTYEYGLTAWRSRPFPLIGQRSPTVTLIVTVPANWWDDDPAPSGCEMVLSPNPLNTSGGHETVEVFIEPSNPAYILTLEGTEELPPEEVLGFYVFEPNPSIDGFSILNFANIPDGHPFPNANFTVRGVSGGIECTAVLMVNFQ
jgi:hypothetical protein